MKQTTWYVVRFALFAVVLGLAVGCGQDNKPVPAGPKGGPGGPKGGGRQTGAAKDPKFKLTAEDMAKEVIADQKAALAKYENQVGELEGLVNRDNQVIAEHAIYVAGAKKQPTDVLGLNILCTLADEGKDKVWWLGKGQKVKVVGQVTGANSFAIALDRCSVTPLGESPTPKVTAEQIAADFAKDEEAAKKKYKIENFMPQEIIVEGTVADLEKKNDFHLAKLAGADGVTVSCTIDKKTWEGLKKGDKVTIKGDLSVFSDKKVGIDTAFLLKKG